MYGVFSLLNLLTEVIVEQDQLTGRNVSIDGEMSDALSHFAFQASMKRRLMKMMQEKRIQDSESRQRKAAEEAKKLLSTTPSPSRGKLGKFYGLPPQSIMDAYMPKSIVDTLTEKDKKGKEKEKKEKEEKEKKEAGKLKATMFAKDWGSFGEKIQEEFEEINKKHMMEQFGEESTTSTSSTTTTPNYDN